MLYRLIYLLAGAFCAVGLLSAACLAEEHTTELPAGDAATAVRRGYRVDDLAVSKPLRPPENIIPSSLGAVRIVSSGNAHRIFFEDYESSVEQAFQRALHIIKQDSFPAVVQQPNYSWQLFFERTGQRAAGTVSSARCHAAWVGPPANIFISSDKLATNCGNRATSRRRASAELQDVLVHEIAHALEFRLMGKGFARRQRWHSEGFAGWFETRVPGPAGTAARRMLLAQAANALSPEWRPILFQGSKADYARSYALVAVIAEQESIADLFAVYRAMDEHYLRFDQAVETVLGWDLNRWLSETLLFLDRTAAS